MRSLPELTTHVGKESNKLEEVEAGLEHDPDEVWTEDADPERDPWRTLVLPMLRAMPIARLVAETGLHRRTFFALRAGERLPHPRNRQALIETAGAFARERLEEAGVETSADDPAACAAYLALRAVDPNADTGDRSTEPENREGLIRVDRLEKGCRVV